MDIPATKHYENRIEIHRSNFLSLTSDPTELAVAEYRDALASRISKVNLVIMLATSPSCQAGAKVISDIANQNNIMTAGMVISDNPAAEQSAAMGSMLRPYTSVLAVTSDIDYIDAMMSGLRIKG